MATAPALLSLEEYLRTSYKPDVDFINGEIVERNRGEYEHSKLQTVIAVMLSASQKLWNINVLVEQRIRVSLTNFRVCDVSVLRADAPRERVITTPPFICIEVLSPEDRLARAEEVLADYLRMGVENIWLLDPLRHIAYTFNTTGLHLADPTRLTVPNTPIHLDLAEAFAALD